MTTPTSTTVWNDALLPTRTRSPTSSQRVRRMFAAIAGSYDINNRLHSLGMDQHWRTRAVQLARLKATDAVLDAACGTGNLTLKFHAELQRLGNCPHRARTRRHL